MDGEAIDAPIELDDEEIRVLGCLMEKKVTTPDGYPLTLNAVVAACNQSTNRFPVVRYGETEVMRALTTLREKGLTRVVYSPSNRAPKHRHVVDEVLRLDAGQEAVLGVLMLRGAQTVGELKQRAERWHEFADLAAVEAALAALADRDVALVRRLDRQPGQKDARYVQLLGGPVADNVYVIDPGPVSNAAARGDRVAELEARVEALEEQMAEAKTLLEALRPLAE